MTRPWLLPAMIAWAALAGCAGSTYTIDGATMAGANERAQRYCHEREERARFEGVGRDGGDRIEIYRCLPPRVSANG